MNLKLKSFRFDVVVSPEYMGDIEIGRELTLTMDDTTFNATIVKIEGNRVTHEVVGDEAEMIKPYFNSEPKSFSIESKNLH